jgi:hypothetical protein
MKEEHQNRAIKEVLEFLSKTIGANYTITEYPDKIKRDSPACDMLAIVGSKKVAIEHTSLDSIPLQRKDDDLFMKVLGPLESELKGKLPTPGHYKIVMRMNEIYTGRGISWNDIRKHICQWCLQVATSLKIGSPFTAPRHFIREKPEGVPFEVTLYRWPRRDGQFKIARFAPSDLEDKRREIIYKAIDLRGTKVSEYRKNGFRTILIFESKDIALANASVIGEAFINTINMFNQRHCLMKYILQKVTQSPTMSIA